MTLDAVTTLGSGVDNAVLALGYAYTALSLPYQQTSYSNAAGTTVVNQVQDVYNGLQQLTTEYQEQSGAVSTSTSLNVQYAYSSILSGSLLNEMIYPNGRILHYGYDNSTLDTAIGRIDYLADDNGSGSASTPHLVDYSYQGLSTIVGQTYGDGVVLTDTVDVFGNIADLNYAKSGTSTDHFQYGYDRAGNVLYKNNLLSSSFSELYHANSSTSGDDNTAYDPLGRLTAFSRGTLSASANNGGVLDTVTTLNSTSGLTADSQSWSLDAIGNQTAVTTDGTATSNTQNSQNELTGFGGNPLTFDNNGNTTTDENGNTLTYDAWNRLATDSAGTTAYAYDAEGRRIAETHSTTTTNLYFTTQGQVIEEQASGAVTAQNVFSIEYVNALLLRDDNSTSGNLGISGSGLGTRLYSQHDANWNQTATVDTGGNVIQRFVYTSYGEQTALSGPWLVSGTNSIFGFQDGRFDVATGMNHFDNRDYRPSLAVWMQNDPAGNVNGLDIHLFVGDNPIKYTDPTGESIWGAISGGISGFTAGFESAIANGASPAAAFVGGVAGATIGTVVGALVPAEGPIGGAIGGAVGGGIGNFIGQEIGNLANGRSLSLSNICWGSVAGAAVAGAVTGLLPGAAPESTVAEKAAMAVAKGILSGQTKTGGAILGGQACNTKKPPSQASPPPTHDPKDYIEVDLVNVPAEAQPPTRPPSPKPPAEADRPPEPLPEPPPVPFIPPVFPPRLTTPLLAPPFEFPISPPPPPGGSFEPPTGYHWVRVVTPSKSYWQLRAN
jgi:RHS repeat-associated protein